MKRILIFFCSLLFIYTATAQTAPKSSRATDSLEKLIPVQRDSALVGTYNELTWEFRLLDRDKAIQYGNEAIELAGKLKFYRGMAQAYNDLGIIYFDMENYDTAIALYSKAVSMRKEMNDELGIAKLYNKIGIVYQKQGSFAKALDYQLQALPIFEKFKNDIGVSYSLNNIGILNQNLGRYDEAIHYQQRSIAIKEKIGDKTGLAGSFVNLANIYLINKDYKQSETYYQKAIDIARTLGDKEYLSNALNNLGNQYQQTKAYDKAIPLINESYQLRNELGDSKGMASCLNNLGIIYTAKKMYDSAGYFLNKGISIATKAVNGKPEANKLYLSASALYEQQNNHTKALEMYKLYANTKDSLFTEDLSQQFAELETRYQTLEKEKTIQQQDFALRQKNYWIAGISGLLILGGLLGYSYYRRHKLKQEAHLQAAMMKQQELSTKAVIEAEEEERKRIARDLHDGVGQMMSAAKMNLSAFESEIKFDNPWQKLSLEKIISLVDESCKEVRSVSHNMMPNALLKSSLSSAVQDFLEKLDKKSLKVHLYTEGLDQRLDANVETVLYRVIQECVNNVIKHAGADSLDISVVRDADGISATIEDNGKGFDITDKEKFEGIGLKNIKTRIGYLKGTVDFDSAQGRGTVVALHVPL
ncbi:MAG TPA: sensor histidine kinase [Chitinophagaceae bacterium]